MSVARFGHASRLFRRALGASIVAAAGATAAEARAWYFPEHVVLAHDGIMGLPAEVRGVLRDAVARARAGGLGLCPEIDVPLEKIGKHEPIVTPMIRSEIRVDCVPYSALSALAGDHASSASELRAVLTSQKGIEITSAVAYEWGRFQDALARLPNTTLERMSFVHELDVAFYFIDPGYELRAQRTRAHFADAGRSIDELVRAAAAGDIDNALGQFFTHHVRSLELASRGLIEGAILEHAFALHFFQDAFSAGHLVMTRELWSMGNSRVRRRHDFFDARGLRVARAMSVEPCGALGAPTLESNGPTPCWVTMGDGHLGISPDASDRLHASAALTKLELEFALAVEPARVIAIAEALGEREQIALEQLVEPVPWWTVRASDRAKLRASDRRAVRLVRAAASAVSRLREMALTPEVVVGGARRSDVFDPRVLASVIDPCVPKEEIDPSLVDPAEDAVPCAPPRALALGTPGTSLIRPLLVEWPASQVNPTALDGESKLDLGWAVQLLASTSAGALFARRAPVDFFAPAIGVSAGFSYRWGTYLPGRVDRSVAELNIGISAALHYDSAGRAGGNPHVTLLDEELRWPILWELLTSYTLPLDLSKGHGAGRLLFVSGARAHEILTSGAAPAFWGIDLEVAAIALSPGRGAYPLYAASPELRLYVGVADPAAAQPTYSSPWGPTVGIAFTGGYATFL
jgi:hypothetical protein